MKDWKTGDWSFTKFKQAHNCKKLFKHIYIDGGIRPSSEFTEYGECVHKTIHNMCKDNDVNKCGHDTVEKWITDKATENKGEFCSTFLQELDTEKMRLVRIAEYLSDKEDIQCEVPINLDMGGFVLKGIIDNLHVTADGTIRVMDYKTSFAIKKEDELKKDRQLKIYGLIVRMKYKDIPELRIEVGHWNWRYNSCKFVEWKEDNIIEELKREAEETIKCETWSASPNEYCYACPMFNECKPLVINEDYGTCDAMVKFWTQKKKKAKPFITELMADAKEIEYGDFKYSIWEKQERTADVNKVVEWVNNGVINIEDLNEIGVSMEGLDSFCKGRHLETPCTVKVNPLLVAKKK